MIRMPMQLLSFLPLSRNSIERFSNALTAAACFGRALTGRISTAVSLPSERATWTISHE
jgi:hypothetical protein